MLLKIIGWIVTVIRHTFFRKKKHLMHDPKFLRLFIPCAIIVMMMFAQRDLPSDKKPNVPEISLTAGEFDINK